MDTAFIGQLYASKISLRDIALYYKFDSTEEFITEFQTFLVIPYQIWLSRKASGPVLDSKTIEAVQIQILREKESPERARRLLIIKIREYARSLSSFSQIMKAIGMSAQELSTYISKKEILRLNDEALVLIRKKQFEVALSEKDSKMLIHLASCYIAEQKPSKPDLSITLNNDQRKVVILPAALSMAQLLTEQKKLNE